MNALMAIVHYDCCSEQQVKSSLVSGLRTLSRQDNNSEIFLSVSQQAQIGLGGVFYNDTQQYFAQNESFSIIFSGKILFPASIQNLLGCNFQANMAQNILLLYPTMENKIFAYLSGYWSLIIYDKNKQRLIAAVDHFGNRSLFYSKTDNCFSLASNAKALYINDKNARIINEIAVVDFLLSSNFAEHKQNFFTDIQAIPAAHFVEYDIENKHFTINPYYTLAYKNCTAAYNEYEEPYFADKIRQKVIEAVLACVDNKTKIAAAVSGGLDSSIIVSIICRYCPDVTLTAFTSTNDINKGESDWAEKLTKKLKLTWKQSLCTIEDIRQNLSKAIDVQNIPLFNLSSFAQYKVMQDARDFGFDSMIDGQGSDELFAGYANLYPPFFKFLSSEWLLKDGIIEFYNLHNGGIRRRDLLKRILKDYALQHLLSKEFFVKKINTIPYQSVDLSIREQYFLQTKNKSNYKKVLNDYLHEQYVYYLPHILRWGAHSANAFGIEEITPFSSSVVLAEAVFEVPSTQKIHQGWSKYMLRKAMIGLVDDEILWRKQKLGFYFPEQQWLQLLEFDMKNCIASHQNDEYLVNIANVLNNWKALFTCKNVHGQRFIFKLYSYLLWKEELNKWKKL